MKEIDKEYILAFAKNDMNLTRASKEVYCTAANFKYHLLAIGSKYKLNPRCFYDLIKLVEIAKR